MESLNLHKVSFSIRAIIAACIDCGELGQVRIYLSNLCISKGLYPWSVWVGFGFIIAIKVGQIILFGCVGEECRDILKV